MAIDYIVKTHKIEVHLHKHGDGEEATQRYKEEYKFWNTINDNLYKAANYISSHMFFNEAYIERLKAHSHRYREIKKTLKKIDEFTPEEAKALNDEKRVLEKQFVEERLRFLKGGDANGSGSVMSSTRQAVVEAFPEIPFKVLDCLNREMSKTFSQYKRDIENGKRTLSNYKKYYPVPFSMEQGKQLRKREDGSIYVMFPGKLEWDLYFGKDPSNNREIVERIFSGEYQACDSSIKEIKGRKKQILHLVVKIPKKTIKRDSNRVVGIDLGVNTPLYAALNDSERERFSIGSREAFLNVRMRFNAQRRELQRNLRHTTNGGHGRKQKLQALERLEGKERNWVHLQNHIFSKSLIEFAQKCEAGVIQMEELSGFGRDKFDSVDDGYKFILRYWSFFELQNMIEYKANAAGIEVRYVNPAYTSQTCSYCKHYEKGQRISQSTFACKNPECTKGKGKQRKDGSYEGINADWNAARNIAKSDKIVDRKKK